MTAESEWEIQVAFILSCQWLAAIDLQPCANSFKIGDLDYQFSQSDDMYLKNMNLK